MSKSQSEDSLFRLVNDVHLAFVRLFNHRAAEFGLTRAHWRVIGGLHRHNGLTQTELANTIAMARSPLGKIIDKLEEAGLIVREPDPDDRRVKRLHLTEASEELIGPARSLTTELEATALGSVPESQHARLKDQLNAIRETLSKELRAFQP